MESFNPMPALQTGADNSAGDAMSLNHAQGLGMDSFVQDIPFDDYSL